MKNKKTLIVGIIAFTVFLIAITIVNKTQKVEVSGKISCNTGFIGLDVEINNIVQNKTCMQLKYNDTFNGFVPDKDREEINCFEQDAILEYFKVKNIDGLNCNMEYSAEVPRSVFDKLMRG